MQIIVSKHIGFCSGVKRCVKLAEEYINKGYKVFAYGELLHNEKEIERLKKLGLEVIEDIEELKKINENVVLVIRTHGIENNIYEEICKLENITIIDGTCPIVKKNQNIINEWTNKGYDAIIYGNIQHPEIKALVSYIAPNTRYYIINSSNEIENINLSDKMILIAQTTKETQEYDKIIEKLKKFSNIKIFYSICKETISREKETEELSKQVDCVVVVGGKNSANTKKLVTIAKKYNKNVIVLNSENFKENIENINNYKKIGIVSGASTPKWLVEKIVGKIKNSF